MESPDKSGSHRWGYGRFCGVIFLWELDLSGDWVWRLWVGWNRPINRAPTKVSSVMDSAGGVGFVGAGFIRRLGLWVEWNRPINRSPMPASCSTGSYIFICSHVSFTTG